MMQNQLNLKTMRSQTHCLITGKWPIQRRVKSTSLSEFHIFLCILTQRSEQYICDIAHRNVVKIKY